MIIGRHPIGYVSFGSSEVGQTWDVGDPAEIEFSSGEVVVDFWATLAPKFVFPGYSSDGTNITIPIDNLIGLTAAEADATTGDWREILQAWLLKATEYQRSIVWSSQARAYDIFQMDRQKIPELDRYFRVNFYINYGVPHVAPEP